MLHIVEYRSAAIANGIIRIDADFVGAMSRISQYAVEDGVKLWVTSSFRERGTEITGAIVKQASKSCHYIGHAIDMNLIHGEEFFNSKKLNRENQENWPAAVALFIDSIRKDTELRWGGDFKTQDPVHIDDNFYQRHPELYEEKSTGLWMCSGDVHG